MKTKEQIEAKLEEMKERLDYAELDNDRSHKRQLYEAVSTLEWVLKEDS